MVASGSTGPVSMPSRRRWVMVENGWGGNIVIEMGADAFDSCGV